MPGRFTYAVGVRLGPSRMWSFETRFLESSRIHSLPGSVRSYCIWSSMVEKAALSVSAFLTSSAVTKGYSPYSRKLGT